MTPFKIQVSVEKYSRMGFVPKVGDILKKLDRGQYIVYCKLLEHDQKNDIWYGEINGKKEKVTIADKHIDLLVVPFENYLKAVRKNY